MCDRTNDADEDSDRILDDVDNCPSDSNEDQEDFDDDNVGDVCDDDDDGDGVDDEIDVCPGLADADQNDFDDDGDGDACDDDDDADEIPDADDDCPLDRIRCAARRRRFRSRAADANASRRVRPRAPVSEGSQEHLSCSWGWASLLRRRGRRS